MSSLPTRTSPRRAKKSNTNADQANKDSVPPTEPNSSNNVHLTPTSPSKVINSSAAKKASTGTRKPPKCQWKECGMGEMEGLVSCSVAGCKKKIHQTCMELLQERSDWFDSDQVENDAIICSKTCYNKYIAAAGRKPTWSNDGEKGPNDPNTSEKILLDWLMAEGNYSKKWRGKDSKGKKKKHVAAEIAQAINAAKVRVQRDGKQVMNKISHIEKSFRCAHDFANTETGQGLKANNWGEFDEAVRRKCQYYFDLLEIFGDRASAKPKAMSNENLDSSEDEKSTGENEDIFSVEQKSYGEDSGGDIGIEGISDSGSDCSADSKRGKSKKKKQASAAPVSKSGKDNGGSAGKKKKAASNMSVQSSAKKRSKTAINLFDSSTADSLTQLAVSQQKVAEVKLQLLENEKIQSNVKLRIELHNMIQQFHENNPNMSKEEAETLFPADAKDIVNMVYKEH